MGATSNAAGIAVVVSSVRPGIMNNFPSGIVAEEVGVRHNRIGRPVRSGASADTEEA